MSTFDAATSSSGAAISSLNWSHTCTGANRGIIVGESVYAPADRATGITYNTVALTSIGGIDTGSGDPGHASQWRLIAPATGSNTIAVTFGGSVTAICGAVSATDVHQTTMVGTQATANAASGNPTVNVTTVSGELVADSMGHYEDGAGSPTVGAGQTERWSDISQADTDGAGSTEVASGASTTMSWTLASSGEWAICGVAFKTVAIGGATGKSNPLMGPLGGPLAGVIS